MLTQITMSVFISLKPCPLPSHCQNLALTRCVELHLLTYDVISLSLSIYIYIYMYICSYIILCIVIYFTGSTR